MSKKRLKLIWIQLIHKKIENNPEEVLNQLAKKKRNIDLVL